MSTYERIRLVAFSAITALGGVLIVVISNYTLFPEFFFYSIVMILMGVIVILVVYAFLWERTIRFLRMQLWRRKRNILARKYFADFRDFVNRFTSLPEFNNIALGITGVLGDLPKKTPKDKSSVLISSRTNNFSPIVKEPLSNLKRRLDDLSYSKSEMNYEFLRCLVKQFENYVKFHKMLYVDFSVTMAREIGLDNIPKAAKRMYKEYKDDYNEFIFAYTEFAKRSAKATLGVFNEHLQKAHEL